MSALAGKTFLVVDDSRAMRQVISGMLRSAGAGEVFVAADGLQALEIVDRESVDAVVTDLIMVPMDGIALTRALRRVAGRDSRLPVVMLTSQWDPETEEAAWRDGVDGFLLKPVASDILTRQLELALTRKPPIRLSA